MVCYKKYVYNMEQLMRLALNYATDGIEVYVGNGSWNEFFTYPISPPEYDNDVYLY
jgi:hypothetical protein